MSFVNLLSTQDAARLAGVAPSTIKRWADQGVLKAIRTAGGHRRFSPQSLQQFLRAQPETSSAGGVDPMVATWIRAMIEGQKHQIDAQLLEARARLGAWHLVADELGAAISELGAEWACGKISIAEEHMASHNLARCLARAADAMPGPSTPGAPRCLLACAEGEEHTLGLSLAELCLRELGWRAIWLGNRTPTEEVLRLIENNRVDVVTLSASETLKDAAPLKAIVTKLETACTKQQVGLVLGGSGPWPEQVAGGVRVHSFGEFHHYIAQRKPLATRSSTMQLNPLR